VLFVLFARASQRVPSGFLRKAVSFHSAVVSICDLGSLALAIAHDDLLIAKVEILDPQAKTGVPISHEWIPLIESFSESA